ncbi:hypothetical protein AERO9AM_11044 [Aeromicrobium sp. 9AM]|nr:hypothetical protein AERO9AM_11044 [Aeromicrobium sp. 9AM]
MTLQAKREFLAKNSYAVPKHATVFDEWIAMAFDEASDYVKGERPTCGAVSEIDIHNDECDARSWLWEARVPRADYSVPPLLPKRVIFKRSQKELYLDWVVSEKVLGYAEAVEHIALVESMADESDIPVDAMIHFLVEG